MRFLPVMLLLWAVPLAGCNSSDPGGASANGRVRVVAAENFWGSIAAQLGGDRVDVRSIISEPSTDPHSYEPAAADARTMAGAQLAILNGVGYDEWASHLLEASPQKGRAVLDIGRRLGLGTGANPHRWYDPADVGIVAGAIAQALARLDPAGARYFAARRARFERVSLARYDALIKQIRVRYAGVPVGYSESIFRPLGEDLGLKLLTPYSFAKAVAEGTDVTAEDKEAVDRQARDRQIKVWVFNSQNVTPDVQRVNELAKDAGIPIATVTETLSPASDTFEQWQVGELEGLTKALHEATGS